MTKTAGASSQPPGRLRDGARSASLFPSRDPKKSARLMAALDAMNGRYLRACCLPCRRLLAVVTDHRGRDAAAVMIRDVLAQPYGGERRQGLCVVCPLKSGPSWDRLLSLTQEFGMSQKKHKSEEIVAKLRQVDVLMSQGRSVTEAVRAISVTPITYYRWREEFGGLKGDQVKLLKDLEHHPLKWNHLSG